MGPPGSGKSTLARILGARHDLPVFHLDQAYWQPGWVQTSPDLFQAEVAGIAAAERWVIDGNYTDTLAPRLRVADTLIYLDVPNWLCMLRILRRTWKGYGRVRADGPAGCAEQVDIPFLRFAWTWNRVRRARNLALVAGFSGRLRIVRGRAAYRALLAEF
jgi:adenylate kinase family enzyme